MGDDDNKIKPVPVSKLQCSNCGLIPKDGKFSVCKSGHAIGGICLERAGGKKCPGKLGKGCGKEVKENEDLVRIAYRFL